MVSRYGVKIRKTEDKIRKEQRKDHVCPTCGKTRVRRVSTAIWSCSSCKAVFAGGTYSPQTETGVAFRTSSQKSGAKAKG